MTKRPTYSIVVRPEPGVVDPERALRALLKLLLRRFGLRCVRLTCAPPDPSTPAPEGANLENDR